MESRFAVVRTDSIMRFSKWHETYEKAREEAERLCRKEGVTFFLLKEVARCEVELAPIKWTECVGEKTVLHKNLADSDVIDSNCQQCGVENHCPCKHCVSNGSSKGQDIKWKWSEDGNVALCGNCGNYLFS